MYGESSASFCLGPSLDAHLCHRQSGSAVGAESLRVCCQGWSNHKKLASTKLCSASVTSVAGSPCNPHRLITVLGQFTSVNIGVPSQNCCKSVSLDFRVSLQYAR